MSSGINLYPPVNSLGALSFARFLKPKEIIDKLEIGPGMKIAHFGCGTGYFTLAVAQKIGGSGTVYALDILCEKIDALKSQAKSSGFKNILTEVVNLENREGSKISEGSVDWVMIVNMLYQNEKKTTIIGEAKRILKENGKILIIDWKDNPGTIGPEMKSRVSREELIKIIRKHELGIIKELEISDFHFGMILAKGSSDNKQNLDEKNEA